MEHQGELVEKTALMKAIWPNVIVEENNLNQCISAVRRALGENTAEHRYIVTVPGRGYRFVASVTTLAAAPSGQQRTSRRRLAVLPFENLSPDPSDVYFADGLHEEVLATLAHRVPDMDVISRTTMMTYRREPKAVQQVARDSATHLLEGSVRREQRNVRMSLRLIDARDDRNVWSQTYDRTLSDALTLQSEVAGEVASQLSLQLSGGPQITAPPTANPEAYDLYLKVLVARRFLGPFSSVERYRDVEALLTRAIELDPKFALAHAARATFGVVAFAWNFDTSEEQLQLIGADLAAALRLAPDDPIVLAADAGYWSWVERDLPRALERFQAAGRAGLADPMYQSGWAATLLRMGQMDEAARITERLMALDPANPFIFSIAAAIKVEARQPVEALRILKRALDQSPDYVSLRFIRATTIFAYTGRTDEWRAVLDEWRDRLPATALLDHSFACMRCEQRFAELREFLESFPAASVRIISGMGGANLYGAGERPTAELRGWTYLLLGDSVAAEGAGRDVRDFLARNRRRGRGTSGSCVRSWPAVTPSMRSTQTPLQRRRIRSR